MASVRLPLLWSTVCRGSEIYNPALRSARAALRMRAYHPTWRIRQEQIPQRYGTANEPPPRLKDDKDVNATSNQQSDSQGINVQAKIGENFQKSEGKEVKTEVKPETQTKDKTEPTTADGSVSTTSTPIRDPMVDSSSSQLAANKSTASFSQAIDTILDDVESPHQPPVEQVKAETGADSNNIFDEHGPHIKAPHIEQPRYIHHFDTYGLVQRLKDSGWDEEQAITVMKAMRMILVDHADLAKEALVSRSNLENEAYLFKAACAELRTEVTTRRKNEQQKLRTERTQLQHEVDIISQRLGQESTMLKDELKGLFDDRKMAVRNEQRDMESKVQQLGYRITVELASDAKSQVEELRWIMTRRVIITLGLVVLMIVGSLKAAATTMDGNHKPAMVSGGTQTESASADRGSSGGDGTNAGFESLG